jgi:hypothetical protein
LVRKAFRALLVFRVLREFKVCKGLVVVKVYREYKVFLVSEETQAPLVL